MQIDIFTLFPAMFRGPFEESIVKRAIDKGLLEINIYNIRDFTTDKHHVVDDYPYGGGAGMVMKPEPIFAAVESVIPELTEAGTREDRPPVVLMTPQGRLFNQKIAEELSQEKRIVLLCGHYEGVDERVREHLVTDEISIGDYVLTGGELPAMVVADAVVRLLPGVLGSIESAGEESHSKGLLEYPQYTRPPVFRGWSIPDRLLSGHHAEIAKWRRRKSIERTIERRPELLAKADLTEKEKQFVRERLEEKNQETE